MTLIIEDGTGKADAQSYVTAAEVRAYAEARGCQVDQVDYYVEAQILRSMRFFEGYRDRFGGYKLTEAQSLQFPRAGCYIDGYYLDQDAVPQLAKDAICELVIAQVDGVELQPTITPMGDKKSVKVGPVEVEYAETRAWVQPTIPAADAFILPLLTGGGRGLSMTRV